MFFVVPKIPFLLSSLATKSDIISYEPLAEEFEAMKFNTAISALMILANTMEKMDNITKKDYRTFLHLLNPVAPHTTEELNEMYELGKPLCESAWPTYEDDKLVDEEKTIAVQVNGKVRATINVNINDTDDVILEKALAFLKLPDMIKEEMSCGSSRAASK